MAKHLRRSRFARNAAAFGATVAGVSALMAPAAAANPLAGIQGVLGGLQSPNLGNINEVFAPAGARPAAARPAAALAAPVSNGAAIVNAARTRIGSPYVYGATGPNAFDCSGLTSWAYKQVNKSIPRTSQQQAAAGTRVSSPALGDIVVFYPGATHVGIFSGNGNVVHAPQSGQNVSEVPMSYMPVHSYVRF